MRNNIDEEYKNIKPAEHVAEHIVSQAIKILEPASKENIIRYAFERGLTEKEIIRALKKFKKSKNKIETEQIIMMGNLDKNTCEALGGTNSNGECIIIKRGKSPAIYKKA